MEDQREIDLKVWCDKTKVKIRWNWKDYIKLAYLLNNERQAYILNSTEDFHIKFEAPQHFSLKTRFSPTQKTVDKIMNHVKQTIFCNTAAVLVEYKSELYKGLETHILKSELSKYKLVYVEEQFGVIYVAVDKNYQKAIYSLARMMDDKSGSSGETQTDQAGMQASGGSDSQKPPSKSSKVRGSSMGIDSSVSWSFAGTTVQVVNATRVYTGTFKYQVDIFVTTRTTEVQLEKKKEHCTIQFPVRVEKNGKLDKVNLDRHVGTLLEAVDSYPVVIPLDGLKQVSVKKFLKKFLEKVLSVLEDEAGFKTRKKYSIIFISKSDSLQDATKACDMMLQSKNGWQKEEPIGITTTKNIGDMEDTASDKGSADEHQAQQAKMHEDGNKRNTDKQSSRNPADDHSSSFTSSEQHIRHRISVPLNISDKGLDFFLNGILTKYREKGFIFNIKDDCMVYDGPSELHGIFQTEFQSARSKISSIQTDSLVIEQHIVVDDVDSLEFENDGVFLEYVPENNVINFNGLQWSDIQRVKQKYQTRLCPQKIRVRGKRHFNQNHLNTNEHEDGDVNTLHKEDKFSWSSSTSDLVVYEAKGVTVKVYSADILHVPVDCIVNAANPQLNHQGGVAKVIAKAAGKKLRQDGEDYIKKHGNLQVGEACSTSAGKLPYHHVTHAVGPCWSWYKPHTEADIQECENDLQMAIKNSLSEADRLGHSSIAIPAVSSGKFGCPEDFCAVQYAHAILDYVSTSSSPIKEIHFVDTNKDIVKVIHHAFRFMLPKGTHPRDYDRRKYIQTTSQPPPKKKGLKHSPSAPSKSAREKTSLKTTYQDDYGQPHPYCEPPSHPPTGHEIFTCFFTDNKKLLVYTDNILTSKNKFDMKACAENVSGNGKGYLALEFAKQGGSSYHSDKRLAFIGKKPGDVVVCKTDFKKCKCRFVAHAILPHGKDASDDAKLNSTFRELFKAVVTNKCESLALPLLGTGRARLQPTYVTKRLYESLKEFSNLPAYKTHPIEVHLISFERADTNIIITTIQGEVGNVRASQAAGFDRRQGHPTHNTGAGGARPKSSSFKQKHPTHTTEDKPSTRGRHERSKERDPYLHEPSRIRHSPSNKYSRRDSDESDSSSDNEQTNRSGKQKPFDSRSSANNEQSSLSSSQRGKGNLAIFDCGEENSDDSFQRLKTSDENTGYKPAVNVDSDSSDSDLDDCVICMDKPTDPKTLSCGHKFCRDCIDAHFAYKKVCPTCGAVCGIITGDQPEGTMDVYISKYPGCAGYEHYGRIQITYTFQNGVQQSNHPSPGKHYRGIRRSGYLPDNKRGRQILEMLRVAFERKLVFTIGNSRTTGQQGVITWNDIHHKTDPNPNTPFGYPDPTYLDRVEDELKAKGVTLADIQTSPRVSRSTRL